MTDEITSEAGSSSSLPEATVLVVESSKRNVFSVENLHKYLFLIWHLGLEIGSNTDMTKI